MKENFEENLIFGRHPVKEALKAGRPLDKIIIKKGVQPEFYREIKKAAALAGVPFTEADGSALDRLSGGVNHQGVVARASYRNYDSLEDIFKAAEESGRAPFILVLNLVQDPHNLGSLIRSALGAGVHGVVISRHRAARLSPAVSKVSAGADAHMKVALVTNIGDTILALKEKGLKIVGAESDGETSAFDFDYSGPLALVLGGEDSGLGTRVKSCCDFLIKIPLTGPVSSLNVGVAGAILMFKAAENR